MTCLHARVSTSLFVIKFASKGAELIGLVFLAVGLLWLWLSWFMAIRLPKWLGVTKPVWRWGLGSAVFLLFVLGPFVDHIVGMRQFEKLCAEQTGLQIYPDAANTKRGIGVPAKIEPLEGYAVQIRRQTRRIFDLDTQQVIAQYNHFATRGGTVGGLVMLGGEYTCSVSGPRHPDHRKFTAFAAQVKLTYGKVK